MCVTASLTLRWITSRALININEVFYHKFYSVNNESYVVHLVHYTDIKILYVQFLFLSHVKGTQANRIFKELAR